MVKLKVNFCGRQSCIPHEGVVFLSQSSLHTNKTWQLEIPHQPGPWRKKPVWRPGCCGKLPGLILLHARYLLATLCLLTNAKSLSEVKHLSPVFPSTWVKTHHYMQSFSVMASISFPQIPAPGSPGCLPPLSPDTLYIAYELKEGGFLGRVGSWLLSGFLRRHWAVDCCGRLRICTRLRVYRYSASSLREPWCCLFKSPLRCFLKSDRRVGCQVKTQSGCQENGW